MRTGAHSLAPVSFRCSRRCSSIFGSKRLGLQMGAEFFYVVSSMKRADRP